jgi:HK97 family phage prohead protease
MRDAGKDGTGAVRDFARGDPAGWDFAAYLRNPVVQWAHRFDIPAIGRAADLFVDDGGLHGSIVFNGKDFDAFGWGIGERVRRGVLRAGSVGFRPLEVETVDRGKAEGGGEKATRLIIRRQELLEFSICNVPANPWALREEEEIQTNSGSEKAIAEFFGGLVGV